MFSNTRESYGFGERFIENEVTCKETIYACLKVTAFVVTSTRSSKDRYSVTGRCRFSMSGADKGANN